MAELDEISVVAGIPNGGTGEVPTLAPIRDLLAEVLAGIVSLSSATGAIAVTPSDATVLANVRAIYVGTGGDLVATIGGTDVTFANVPDGTQLIIEATKILAATTATDIVALT